MMTSTTEQKAVPVAQESGMDRAKARRAARDASGELYVDHSIFVGIEACLTRNGKTVAHVVKYADAVEIADAVDRLAGAGKAIVGEARIREIAASIYAEVADEPLGDLTQRRQAVQDMWHDAVRAALSAGVA